MISDITIAQQAELREIFEIAERLGIAQDINPFGKYIAKIPTSYSKKGGHGHLVLVTAMTPTRYGEGKTTNTIGLAQALQAVGASSMAAIREPSLGPCMGIKGGAAGGGYSQVLPMEEINLHFTGDIHAVTIAHNLLSAMIDNHIHQRLEPMIHPAKVIWNRVIDMNDRSLRSITIGLSDHGENGIARMDGFQITASSEIMAILCLAEDIKDLKYRLGKITIGRTFTGEYVTAHDIGAEGAMAALLKQAIEPNLVQSIEGVPILIHGGPFANIAHGSNSIIATKTALNLADYTITEAGFASELGAEKFFNITSRIGGFRPDVAVLVVTLRAYEIHGIENILKHVENIRTHGVKAVISINKFLDDPIEELTSLQEKLAESGVDAIITDFRESGGQGGTVLAHKIIALCEEPNTFHHLYKNELPIKEKIERICSDVYGAGSVVYAKGVRTKMKQLETAGFGHLPICMAKTQSSLSDNPKLTGCPKGFPISISKIEAKTGAGFIVAYTGEIMTMPGLPKRPSACDIDITEDGTISGLF